MKHSHKQLSVRDLRTEEIREALIDIGSRSEGRVNPYAVVEQASDPASVLHPFFEWDDSEAGKRYRLAQAEGLIRRVKLTVMRRDPASKTIAVTSIRAFQSRTSQRKDPNSGYESIDSLLSDPEKRNELLAQVLRELKAYQKRYSALAELASVWNAIADVVVELEPLSVDAPNPEDRPSI